MRPAIDTGKLVRWYDFQAPFYRLWRHGTGWAIAANVARRVAAKRLVPARVLDAGCGSGLFSLALAQAVPQASVVGIDLSAGMLSAAAREARGLALPNLRLARADVCRLPFRDEAFDLVVAAGLLPNVNDWRQVLRELRRVLRPSGSLLLVEVDREAMSTASRLAFWAMIQGQRFVSRLLPRFRFAAAWDTRASTVDRPELESAAAAAGLRTCATARGDGHLLLELEKEPAA